MTYHLSKLGFTIIEILIVITIISIVSVFSAMNISSQRNKHTLITTAEKIKSDIEQARTDATNGNSMQVSVTNEANKCLYIGTITAINTIDCTTQKYNLPSSIIIKEPNNQSITFDPVTGIPNVHPQFNPPNNGLELQSGNFKIKIFISSSGVITISDPYQ